MFDSLSQKPNQESKEACNSIASRPWLFKEVFFIAWWMLCVRYFFSQIGDDSYIFFRYAELFGQGHGLTWNVDTAPVEGFSSPLWTLWLGAWSKWIDVVLVAQWTGLICLSLSMAQLYRFTRGSMSVLWGCSFTLGLQYWGSSGLETSLYTLLLLNVLPLLNEEYKGSSVLNWTSLALLGICRPEAPALVVLVLCLQWWKERRFSTTFLLVCIPMVCWQLFRWFYYGDVLPNTYWAKASGDVLMRMEQGMNYAGWLVVPLFIGTWKSPKKIDWVLIGALWSIVVVGGGDWMWHHRLLVPIIVSIWMLSYSMRSIWKWMVQACLVYYWMSPSILLAVIASICNGKTLPIVQHQEGNLIEVSEKVALEIRAAYPEPIRIAINHAGAIPYFLSEYEFIDMSALNDRHLARLEGGIHEKYDANYVLSLKPDLVILNSFVDPKMPGGIYQPNYWMGETEIYEHPRFMEEYVPIARSWRRVTHGGGIASIWLFQRRRNLSVETTK